MSRGGGRHALAGVAKTPRGCFSPIGNARACAFSTLFMNECAILGLAAFIRVAVSESTNKRTPLASKVWSLMADKTATRVDNFRKWKRGIFPFRLMSPIMREHHPPLLYSSSEPRPPEGGCCGGGLAPAPEAHAAHAPMGWVDIPPRGGTPRWSARAAAPVSAPHWRRGCPWAAPLVFTRRGSLARGADAPGGRLYSRACADAGEARVGRWRRRQQPPTDTSKQPDGDAGEPENNTRKARGKKKKKRKKSTAGRTPPSPPAVITHAGARWHRSRGCAGGVSLPARDLGAGMAAGATEESPGQRQRRRAAAAAASACRGGGSAGALPPASWTRPPPKRGLIAADPRTPTPRVGPTLHR